MARIFLILQFGVIYATCRVLLLSVTRPGPTWTDQSNTKLVCQYAVLIAKLLRCMTGPTMLVSDLSDSIYGTKSCWCRISIGIGRHWKKNLVSLACWTCMRVYAFAAPVEKRLKQGHHHNGDQAPRRPHMILQYVAADLRPLGLWYVWGRSVGSEMGPFDRPLMYSY